MEVIVVDNASEDGSAAMVAAEFPAGRPDRQRGQRRLRRGQQPGAGAGEGDLLLLLNPDVVVHPDTLTRALAFLRAHPDGGALGCRLIGDGRRDAAVRARLPRPRPGAVGVLRPVAAVPALAASSARTG